MGELTTAKIGQVSAPSLPRRVLSLLAADELDDERRSAGLPPLARVHDRGEVQAALAAIEAALVPASPPQVMAMLSRLAAHFPVSGRSDGQLRSLLADYAEDLEDMPPDIVEAGCAAYRRAGKWWPKSAELLEHMTGPLGARRRQRKRLQRLLATKEKAADQPVSIEERRRVGEKLGQLAKQIIAGFEPGGGDAA